MTGALERPSQRSPETRTAIEQLKEDRDELRLARRVVASTHAAQRMLLAATQLAERHQALALSGAEQAAQKSVSARAIAAKYANLLARVFDCGDAKAAAAARERIRIEEAIELGQLDLSASQRASARRKTLVATLRLRQRLERAALAHRQRRQRAMLAIAIGRLRPAPWPARPVRIIRSKLKAARSRAATSPPPAGRPR